ncbi:uncharacterized protein LOC126842021 [Adelges cooleyi]|uniref:uncharacterized protein LOC126842021 n=1 Tax=Adelges cooleyi TaxID=133065 RepID=UPI002180682C|nr:uncharacterized protein LOC126842021 [Adelges cooleyi]
MSRQVTLTLVCIMIMVKLAKPCDKALIKIKLVSACAMQKRSLLPDRLNSLFFSEKFASNYLEHAEQQYKRLMDDDVDSDTLSNKDQARGLRRPDYLSFYDLYIRRSNRQKADNDDDRLTANQKRSIQHLIEECCHKPKECSEADFREICDKK